jgi:hypothetical protein
MPVGVIPVGSLETGANPPGRRRRRLSRPCSQRSSCNKSVALHTLKIRSIVVGTSLPAKIKGGRILINEGPDTGAQCSHTGPIWAFSMCSISHPQRPSVYEPGEESGSPVDAGAGTLKHGAPRAPIGLRQNRRSASRQKRVDRAQRRPCHSACSPVPAVHQLMHDRKMQ